MVLESIKYTHGSLSILNQLALPFSVEWQDVSDSDEAWHAIHDMRVRGAPLIATVAMLGLAVEMTNLSEEGAVFASREACVEHIWRQLKYLKSSRPTAVNLSREVAYALVKIRASFDDKNKDCKAIVADFIEFAERLYHDEVAVNKNIGAHGASWITAHARDPSHIRVLTHCNTGSLATTGYGTALGVVRSLHSDGVLERAYCTETRPYNQGARLTAFELVHDAIPSTLICDSMAAAAMQLHKIDAVVVGADRVAQNGDTANKIGTYALAILARHHGVKFLVAAPTSSIDANTANGAEITIEERAADEMTMITGPRAEGKEQVDTHTKPIRIAIAAKGIEVWNPAFDVTPADLIDGIVTENGVIEREPAGYSLREHIPQNPKEVDEFLKAWDSDTKKTPSESSKSG